MATENINVKIALDNSQYVAASNQVVKSTQKMESESKRSYVKMDNASEGLAHAIKRRFGFAALFGAGFAAAFGIISSIFKGIGDSIGRAMKNNTQFGTAVEELGNKLTVLFDGIASFLMPIIESLVNAANKLLNIDTSKFFVSNLRGQIKSGTITEDQALTKIYEEQGRLLGKNLSTQEAINNLQKNLDNILENSKDKKIEEGEITGAIATQIKKLKDLEELRLEIIERQRIAMEKSKKENESRIKKELDETEAKIKASSDAFVGLSTKMLDLLPIEGEMATQLKEITNNIMEMTALVKKIDFSNFKLQGADITSIFMVLVGIFAQLKDNVDKYNKEQFLSNSANEAAQRINSKLVALLTEYDAIIQELNYDLKFYTDAMDYEEAVRNKTTDDIDREIKTKQDLIDTNEKLIKTYKDLLDNSPYNPKDLEGRLTAIDAEKQSAQGFIDSFEKLPAYVQQILKDKNSSIYTDYINAKTRLIDLENEKNYVNDIIEARDNLTKIETTDINLQNDIDDLLTDRLAMEQAITDEIQTQVDLMKKYVDLGADLENIRTVKTITRGLEAQGLSGVELGGALQNLGVGNKAISGRTLNIFGDINNTLNQASVNASINSLNNIIGRLGGV